MNARSHRLTNRVFAVAEALIALVVSQPEAFKVECTDASGNSATGTVNVTVPK